MTAAGLASLFITQDYLLIGRKWDPCHGGTRDEHIEKGLAWMDKNVHTMLEQGQHYYYGLYGIERIGVASGRKYFGTVDWYKAGADELVKKQAANGSWGNLPDTVFAMLFLVRGRAPVVMNKLEYAAADPKGGAKKQEEPWNERPRDVANFAHWSTKQIEQYLNWQIVNLKVSADDLHDAPILYISGSEALNFGDAEIKKLREFAQEGGLILGNADCGSLAFSKSFIDLGSKAFPKYEFRDLPANHPIFTDEQFKASKWKTKPRVQALSNGVRELMVLVPEADLGRAWQTRSEKTREDLFQLGQDLFLYAVDKSNLRARGETYIVRADAKVKAAHELKVARLVVGENPDPEPAGWHRLGNLLHNHYKLDLAVENVKPGDGKLAGFKLAHLTGTTKFKLTPEQQKELKAFADNGGTLVVDAAGGSSDFADSAEVELAAVFGGSPGTTGAILPPTHAVYARPGAKVEKFGYREFVRGKLTGRLDAPRVRGIEQGGRVAVFYSREDLSAGMVGEPVDGVLGYNPETATEIMRNIVLSAAPQGQGAGAESPAKADETPDPAKPAPNKPKPKPKKPAK